MTLTEKSRALVVKIEKASSLPLALRAAQAVVLVPETAALLVELSEAVERHESEFIKMRGDVTALVLRDVRRIPGVC